MFPFWSVAQDENISDESLWYLDTKVWLAAAGILLIVLYAFYRMFKPRKKNIDTPAPAKQGATLIIESPTDITTAKPDEDPGINEQTDKEENL